MAWPSNEAETIPAIQVEGSPEWLADRDKKITEWLANKQLLEAAKEAEMQSRKILGDKLFPSPNRGTNRVSIGNGYSIKLLHGLNYTLFKDKVFDDGGEEIPRSKLVEALEDRLDALGEAAAILCSRLIKWTPSLVDSEYRKLDPESTMEMEVKAEIDKVLTVESASPQMTFEKPKG